MDVIEYRGWKNNLRLTNGDAELVVTLDVGPRVISYRLPGGVNVMKNYAEMMGGTGEPEWQIRGGHRFWLAPEDLTRTYFPDNRPVKWEAIGTHGARFTPPPETEYGVQKVMELRLADRGTRVEVTLRVTNIGTAPTELAPWGPTVMAPGGVEVIPLPPKKNHPLHPKNAKSPADFAPNQELILWPYFDFADTRWTFGAKYALPPPGREQGADENRARPPGGVGGVPELRRAVREAVRLPRGGGVPGPRHPLPDVLERGHAGDGDGG